MRAQVTLLPTESKKLISKAVAKMDVVRRSFAEGIIVLHPSSSTYFIAEELLGKKPDTNFWVCGIICSKGTCVEMGAALGKEAIVAQQPEESAIHNPLAFRMSWVIRGGELASGISLAELLDQMGPEDVYIKGVNALDVDGNVGVLIGNPIEGGTIGRVTAKARQRGFHLIFPVGLEKLIPMPIKYAVKEALKNEYKYSMGVACGLFPCDRGLVITELKAIEILANATAIPISAGGIGGAEGAITMIIKGDDEQVNRAVKYIEECKAARLPPVRTFSCHDCPFVLCEFPLRGKPWII
jgi:hypothetical protein